MNQRRSRPPTNWFLVFLIVSLVIVFAPNARSQSSDNLHFSVDRPGISDYPTIVPKGWLQLETGVEYYQREDFRSIAMPSLLLRTAVTKGIEVRMINRYLRIDSLKENPDDKHHYFGALEIKAAIVREKGWLPATSLLAGFSITPEATKKLRGPIWGDYALLLFENNLHDKVLFNYNAGIIWNGSEGSMSTMYSFAFEIELSTQHAVFVEQSTFFNPGSKNDYWFDAGYTHLAAKHSQIDFSVGVDLNGDADDFFVAVGYSTRIQFKKEK
jgi:hypothetical protein